MSPRRKAKRSVPPAPAARPARALPWRWVAVLVLIAALAVGGWHAWRWYRLPARATAAIPHRPALEGWPAALRDGLLRAEQRAPVRAESLDALADLGRLYHANGFSRQAEACWRFLHTEQPQDARWPYLLADLRRAASDYDAMESLLRGVVRLAPGYAPAWLKWGDYAFKTGRLDEARRAYGERLALVAGDPYAMLGLARIALLAERKPEAHRLIESVVRDHPRFAPAQNLLAELLAAEGDTVEAARHRQLGLVAIRYSEAEDPWLDELTEWCFDAKRLRTLATIQYQTEHGPRALQLMERAVRLAPQDPEGFSSLGDLYLKLGQADRARDALERCLNASGTRKPAILDFVNLSQAHRLLKQPQEAHRVIRQALELYPAAFELFDELGVVLDDLGQTQPSLAAFRRAIELNPGDPDGNFRLAIGLLGVGRREEAYGTLEHLLAAKPGFPPALSLLARLELEDGKLGDAEKHLRTLHDAYPDVYESRYMLGKLELIKARAAEAAGDKAGAEQHYRSGVSLDEKSADLQVGLGLLLLLQGNVDQAVAPLDAYRQLRPDDPRGALYLGQAYARLGRLNEARAILTQGADQADRVGNQSTAKFCREILQGLATRP